MAFITLAGTLFLGLSVCPITWVPPSFLSILLISYDCDTVFFSKAVIMGCVLFVFSYFYYYYYYMSLFLPLMIGVCSIWLLISVGVLISSILFRFTTFYCILFLLIFTLSVLGP